MVFAARGERLRRKGYFVTSQIVKLSFSDLFTYFIQQLCVFLITIFNLQPFNAFLASSFSLV